MTAQPLLIFFTGLVIIIAGAEVLLQGASRIASFIGISPMVIGLTVVSIGTSVPELAVGITAVAEDRASLSVGNIAGTNIFNIMFILGLSAAVRPLKVHLQNIALDVPAMILTSIILFIMALDTKISRTEGALLLIAAVVYFTFLLRVIKKAPPALKKEYAEEFSVSMPAKKVKTTAWILNSLLLPVGIGATVFGADLMVSGAVDMATSLGVSDALIGLTIVAIGTSAPELATTIVATIKDDRDVAVGNLIGSSITNILVILGIICLVSPEGADVSNDVLKFDLPLAALVAIVCYPIFRSGRRVSRIEGLTFMVLYLLYLGTLVFLRA